MCCAFLLLEMGPSCVASSDIGRGRPGGVRNANRSHTHAEAAPLRALPRPPTSAPRARTKWPENATVRPQPPSAQMEELSTPTRSHGRCLRAPKQRGQKQWKFPCAHKHEWVQPSTGRCGWSSLTRPCGQTRRSKAADRCTSPLPARPLPIPSIPQESPAPGEQPGASLRRLSM